MTIAMDNQLKFLAVCQSMKIQIKPHKVVMAVIKMSRWWLRWATSWGLPAMTSKLLLMAELICR